MLLPRKTAHQQSNATLGNSTSLTQKFHALQMMQMQSAKKPSFLGDILITRPGLRLDIDHLGAVSFAPIESDDMCEDSHKPSSETYYNPMLYLADREIISGHVFYKAIVLNSPKADALELKDFFANAQKSYLKHPIFTGGNWDKDRQPSLLIPSESVWDNISKRNPAERPFTEIRDKNTIKSILSSPKKMPVLAFSGYIYLSREKLSELLAYDDIYTLQSLAPEIALSPYSESKYLKAFKHLGLEAEDVCSLARQRKKTPNTSHCRIKH
jgi:hypothetical protein